MQTQILINGLPVEGTAYQAGEGTHYPHPLRCAKDRRRALGVAPVPCPVPARFKRLHRSR